VTVVKIGPLAALHKLSALIFLVLKPLGIWGLGGLSLIDSALFPIPVSMDAVLIGYVVSAPHKFLLYCLIAAGASTLGSLVPYYVGRAGGELFLLKRINRERYERMRDRFESQEFLAIMIPTMLPPPTPVKLFEFAAGVFEMRPLPYVLAVFTGKFIQFMICALLTIFFGPTLIHTAMYELHRHAAIPLLMVGLLLLVLVIYMVRKAFDRRSRLRFPAEGTADDEETSEEETTP
jgi:membrane protein YqaA with SNARE-associated domain